MSHARAISVQAVEARLTEQSRFVEGALERDVAPEDASPEIVHQAMRHSVFAGGKWLRPILALAGVQVAGGAPEAVLPAACAVELIHAYSPIHDDLPAMDDSPTRWGRRTDAAQAKVTFPSVFGLAESRRLAQGATLQAVMALEPLGARGRWPGDLAAFLQGRER